MDQEARKQNSKRRQIIAYGLMCFTLLITVYYSYQLLSISENYRVSMNCDEFTDNYRDYCYFLKSSYSYNINYTKGLDYCYKIKRTHLKSHCIIEVSNHIIRETPNYQEIKDNVNKMCNSVEDQIWRSECFFKNAEQLAIVQDNFENAYESCLNSDIFQHHCIGHIQELVCNKDKYLSLNFCETVHNDLINTNPQAVDTCYHHFGLCMGHILNRAYGEDPCAMLSDCINIRDYSYTCIQGLVNVYMDTNRLCECPGMQGMREDFCVK